MWVVAKRRRTISHPATPQTTQPRGQFGAEKCDYFKRARYALILRALVPTSLLPTRETDLTSIRQPAGDFVSRTTTSSLKPNQAVVSVASIRSDLGSAATISHPMSLAACNARGKASSGEAP